MAELPSGSEMGPSPKGEHFESITPSSTADAINIAKAENLLRQEGLSIGRATDIAEKAFNGQIHTSHLDENFPQKKWNYLEDRRLEIHNGGNLLIKAVKDSNPGKEEVKSAMIALLKTSRNLLLIDILDNEVSLAKKNNVDCRPLAEIIKFRNCSEALMKIEGFSIADFLKGGNFKSSQYLKSVVEATTARGDDDSYSKILSENADSPTIKEYPTFAKQALHYACEQLAIFSVITPEIFDEVKVPYQDEGGKKIVSKAKEIIQQGMNIRRDLLKVISSPNSPDFPEMSKTLEGYLDQDDLYIRTHALLKLGLNDPEYEIWAYRMAKIMLSKNEQYHDFYAKLMHSIERFTEDYPREVTIFTSEKTLKFLSDSNLDEEKIPSLEDIRKINEQIFKESLNHRNLKYEISPNVVDFHGTEVLKKIQIEFVSQGDPTKVTVFLYGDHDSLAIGIDTKRNDVDWNSLDDPNEPKMKGMKNSAKLLTRSILLALKEKVIAEKIKHLQDIKGSMPEEPAIPTPKMPKRVRTFREKIKIDIQQKPIGIEKIKLDLENNGNQNKTTEKNGVKRHVIVPEDTERPKNIDEEKWKIILQRVKRFNEDGIGDFKMIEKTKHDPVPLYRLRLDKDYRLILIKSDQKNNGSQPYKLHQVLKRKNDYREI